MRDPDAAPAAPACAGEATLRYFDRSLGCQAVKVLPGEFFVTDEDLAVVTVLGSCVSACLHDPGRAIGGLNHFMLPGASSSQRLAGSVARYGAQAMDLLIGCLLARGARQEALEAKVFGGAQLLDGFAGSAVGQRNAAFVLDYLAARRIPVVASDLLEAAPRRVCFFPVNGRVLVRRLAGSDAETLARRERAYRLRLRRGSPGGASL